MGHKKSIDDGEVALPRNEALRRIGRNVVLFQQLEGILKWLAAAQQPSMPLSKAKTAREERADCIRTQTLGQVAGEVVRALYADANSESTAPEQITEPWLSFSFRIGADPASIEVDPLTLAITCDFLPAASITRCFN